MATLHKVPLQKGPGRYDISVACFLAGDPGAKLGPLLFTTLDENPVFLYVTGFSWVDGDNQTMRFEKRVIELRGLGSGFAAGLSPLSTTYVVITLILGGSGMLYVVEDLHESVANHRIYKCLHPEEHFPHFVYRNAVQEEPGKIQLTQCDGDGYPLEQARRFSLVPAAFYRLYKLYNFK